MSFTDRKPFTLDAKSMAMWRKSKPDDFGCLLCGHVFQEGDTARWIYANGPDSVYRGGNFFVCSACDDGDEACRTIAAEMTSDINPILRRRLHA